MAGSPGHVGETPERENGLTKTRAPASTRERTGLDDPTLSLRERLEQAPEEGRVKGWLILSVLEGAKRNGVADLATRRYVGFKDYPLREYLELLGLAAVRVRPTEAPLRTLRELGRGVYPLFAESLLGRVVLAGLGKGHDGARGGLSWVARVYKLTSNHASASVTELSSDVAVVELNDVWSFPDAYHVGIFEGAARAFGGEVAVVAKASSLSAATLTVTWVSAGV